ncbi:bifunctional diguanylate cyclase/phosphodiesterase [Clostridium sp. 'White wine YQ']|uniref:bifunctional diguanylate cyclase/phosphodiesterase n=1 Tax=Clostridium sp. 'White wine YQ' TaxID=3027474 RepID=UPI0023660C7B|nr:GGDEF domain-containing phosphodiesterase [Clostridium sp. 'White wine YQ']MDD7793618.1 EAL domain-containing protein [Clostridium sp. 'White wine YQ']
MTVFNKIRGYVRSNSKEKNDINYYLNENYKINPFTESLRISIIYGVAGVLWIVLSDQVASIIVSNITDYKIVAMYKGWIYVIVTTLLILLLIQRRLTLFKKAIEKIYSNMDEINEANEELIVLEDELMEQNEQLKKSQNLLAISEQRYELAVEGADCGIWDWDIENGKYYFSDKWKYYLGYSKNEIENNFDAWVSLIHSSERESVVEKINEYISSQEGSYESVYRMKDKSGQYRWILSKGKAIWSETGRPIRIAGSHTDITVHIINENRLKFLAHYDSLTKLPNRLFFEEKVNEIIKCNSENNRFALIYMDVDNFKNINDTLGHETGDLLLKHISDILIKEIKEPSFAARLGGDEFAIIFRNIIDKDEVSNKIINLMKYLKKPWFYNKQKFFISYSIGIAFYPENGDTLSKLLKNADIAMYNIKKNSKDNLCFYTESMKEKETAYVEMVNDLMRAVENKEFKLVYQPIVDLSTYEIVAVEALIRWNHPQKGMISPMEFIHIAEETGLIFNIGRWAFETAINQKKEWENEGFHNILMSVNISGKRVASKNLIEYIIKVVTEAGIRFDEIQLEITETAIMQDIEISTEIFKKLREKGIKIALDDFGTGYSSITYLQKLPIDVVKVDKRFIESISKSKEDNIILETIIKLTHDLNLKLVAEGIETEEQLEFLKMRKCNFGQGYLFKKPVDKEEIKKMFIISELVHS